MLSCKPYTLGVGILTWGSNRTLESTLTSYRKNGLFDFADQSLVFVQEASTLDILQLRRHGLPFLAVSQALSMGDGWRALAENLGTDLLLLLENDCRLVEPAEVTHHQLRQAAELLLHHNVDVVRLRHRKRPGEPLFSLEWKGREMEKPSHLLESAYWLEDPHASFPEEISCQAIQGTPYYLASSSYANYTNLPSLYRRDFWLEQIHPYASGNVEDRLDKVWATGRYTVAQGPGLFEHCRLDRRHPHRFRRRLRFLYRAFSWLGHLFYGRLAR